jgi:hypothetical protein
VSIGRARRELEARRGCSRGRARASDAQLADRDAQRVTFLGALATRFVTAPATHAVPVSFGGCALAAHAAHD